MTNKLLIGTDPNQVPSNMDLGNLAYRNSVDINDITNDDSGTLPFNRPQLLFDANSERLHPTMSSYVRNTNASRINRYGEIEYVTYGTPRFDYDPYTFEPRGLLIEHGSTNQVLYSEDDGNWTIANGNRYDDRTDVRAPDGSYTSTLYEKDTQGSSLQSHLQVSCDATSSYFTVSAFVRKGNTPKIFLQCTSSPVNQNLYVYMNLDEETFTYADYSGTAYPDKVVFEKYSHDWYRIKVTIKGFDGTNLLSGQRWGTYTGANQHGYNNTGHYFWLWGCQLENGQVRASSYIRTKGKNAGSTLTRERDQINLTFQGYRTHGAQFYRNWQKGGATFYIEFEHEMPTEIDVYSGLLSWSNIGGNSTTNRNNLALYRGNYVNDYANGPPYFQYIDSVSASLGINATKYPGRPEERTLCRIAGTTIPVEGDSDTISIELSVDGVYQGIGTDTDAGSPHSFGEAINLILGSFDGGSTIRGYLKKFAIYPKALTRTQMNHLTGGLS
jgi:hypothetical protein